MTVVCRNNPKIVKEISDMIKASIREVSEEFKARRELSCEVQTGSRYSDVH